MRDGRHEERAALGLVGAEYVHDHDGEGRGAVKCDPGNVVLACQVGRPRVEDVGDYAVGPVLHKKSVEGFAEGVDGVDECGGEVRGGEVGDVGCDGGGEGEGEEVDGVGGGADGELH